MQSGLGLHSFKSLDAALYLLGFACLGAKAINELLNVLHLSLMLCRHGLLLLQRRGTLSFKGAVVASIELAAVT